MAKKRKEGEKKFLERHTHTLKCSEENVFAGQQIGERGKERKGVEQRESTQPSFFLIGCEDGISPPSVGEEEKSIEGVDEEGGGKSQAA